MIDPLASVEVHLGWLRQKTREFAAQGNHAIAEGAEPHSFARPLDSYEIDGRGFCPDHYLKE